MYSLQTHASFSVIQSNILISTLFSDTPQSISSIKERDSISHPQAYALSHGCFLRHDGIPDVTKMYDLRYESCLYEL
jgi:hypothetical protein